MVETDVPARLDRLPWARFHWLVIAGLGIAWILDGLEVTLVGSLSGAIAQSPVLRMSAEQVGFTASAYLIGAVAGALLFGYLTDILGRKKLFSITVLLYLVATLAAGASWSFWSFALFRLLTGAGIGGEYAAVNAAIQELIPARRRGFTDLVINGSFWIGAAIGAGGSLVVLDPHILPPEIGWRVGVRDRRRARRGRAVPAPLDPGKPALADDAWPTARGRGSGARDRRTGCGRDRQPLPPVPPTRIRLRTDVHSWFLVGMRALVTQYRRRTVLGVVLMATQAFCYNAVFFTYALILTRFYGVAPGRVGLFILPFAAGNFLGPLVLGHLFDTIGRRRMISATYALSGILMAITGWLFAHGGLSAEAQTAAWTVIFFVASAAASSAYLTVGESFPLEVRAVAIALFYAFGTGVGGVAGPALFGALIDTGSRASIMWGYLLGGGLMVVGAVTAAVLAVNAERRPLEDVAPPLSAVA